MTGHVHTTGEHQRARWRRPVVYSASLAAPRSWPRLALLRPPCGHVQGVGVVWRRQRYLAWRTCR